MKNVIGGLLICTLGGLLIYWILGLPSGFKLPEEPFHAPAANNDLKAMKKLLANGLDVNAQDKNGDTAITYALEYGHIEMAELLIANGAKLDIPDREGRSLGGKVRWLGPEKSVKWLIKRGL